MAEIVNIPPNFGIKKFSPEVEAEAFLKRFGFEMIRRRSDRTVWETTREPKRRAISYASKTGLFIIAQPMTDPRAQRKHERVLVKRD